MSDLNRTITVLDDIAADRGTHPLVMTAAIGELNAIIRARHPDVMMIAAVADFLWARRDWSPAAADENRLLAKEMAGFCRDLEEEVS